jgi:hypothetical protein
MSQTTSVEVETALLERLRHGRPGLSDRELLESVVLSMLGRATLRTIQERNALIEDEAIALGVRAVREARQAGISRLRAP